MSNPYGTPANEAFEVSSVYQMRFITDSDLKPKYIVLKRTAKTVTFQKFQSPNSEKITRKINKDHKGIEYIVNGSYSMAPSISAKHITD